MLRLATFAKFREMQKMILRKDFRENRVRNIAKIVKANFEPIYEEYTVKNRP